MNKKRCIILLTVLIFGFNSSAICGLKVGKIDIVKEKIEELDEKIAEEKALSGAVFKVSKGEYKEINENLVIYGTAEDSYIMWPREKISDATYNGQYIQWKSNSTDGQPEWDDENKRYIYPEGESPEDYPVFKWADELVFEGYDDWRLPTQSELRNLFLTDAKQYVKSFKYEGVAYWSADEVFINTFLAVSYSAKYQAQRNYLKQTELFIRVVRDSE